jgi:hypothetical protein
MPVALIPAALQTVGGIFQTVFSGRRKAERALENEPNPMYAGNKSVNDFYNEAYNRFLTSPTNSAMYQNAMQGINRNTANTLNFLQDRRGALDAVGQVQASQNAGLNNALVNAEQQRNQKFGLLGQATNMKYGDDMQKFQVNTVMPFQRKINLLSTKAANANQTFNTGLSNIFGGLSNASSIIGGSSQNGAAASFGGMPPQQQGLAPINFGGAPSWMNNSNYLGEQPPTGY